MKILKKIGIGLLVIIAILALISIFLPSKVHVQRSIVINAPAKTVFHTVNNFRTWINWSYWDRIDPNMKSTFEGPEAGVGAIHRWESENDSVGVGSMTITESVEPTKILNTLEFSEWKTPGGWLFDETDKGVNTTIFMDLDMPFYARIPGLFMDKMLGKDFEKTLANLKEYTENLPKETAPTPSGYIVETVSTTPGHAMSMHIVTNSKEFNSKMENAFAQIQFAMEKQDLKQAGAMYTIYYKWSKDTVEMEPGIVVNNKGQKDGEVNPAELTATKAIKVDHYGSANTEMAHNFIDEWARKNNINITGNPWEEYITDSRSEPDSTKWLTRVYYPVK